MMGRGGNKGLQTSRPRWQNQILALLAFTLLAFMLTWPLAAHLSTHVPGNGTDDPPLTWNLWWVRYALLNLGSNPFRGSSLFYPLGINLAFYTLTLLNGLLSMPLQLTLGLIPATNVMLLSSFVLSGYGAFLLASYVLAAKGKQPPAKQGSAFRGRGSVYLAAFVAGLVYAFASSKMFYAALGQWNIASSQWIPFYVLYLLKAGDQPRRWRYPLLAALFLLFQAYAELTYASFLVLFTVLWLAWRAAHPVHRRTVPRTLANLGLIGAMVVVGLAPVLAMMVPDLRTEGDLLVQGGGFADVFSADLLGFLVPSMHNPLFGSLVERFHFDHTVGQHIYPGYSVLVLAALGAAVSWRRRTSEESSQPTRKSAGAGAFWTLSTVVFWLMTLGPALRINGHDTGIPLPFALVARLPFFEGNRYPSRYGVMLVLSLGVLAALGVRWLIEKLTDLDLRAPVRRALGLTCCLVLAGGILFEHLSIPLPLSDMRVPAAYQAIAQKIPGNGTLLDLPVAWRNGARVTGTMAPIIMFEQYYQSVHQRPILAGNTSRNPPQKFQYFTEAPVINTLIALETGHNVDPAVVERDRELAGDVLRFFNIQAVVVHTAECGPEMIPYLEATMPVEPFYHGDGIVAYRASLPPWPDAWTITPGDDLSRLSFAEGWSVPAGGAIWAQRQAARLLVPMNGGPQQMSFRAFVPEGGQKLSVDLNGQRVQQIAMAAGWQAYEFALPSSSVREGLNEVWLRFDTLYPAGDASLTAREIGTTGVQAPANLLVSSAGEEVGDFGHIYVNGEDVSPNGRGYNVAVIDPASGVVESTATFDTHLDENASQALAAYLDQVPAGRIVAVAAADEASRLLGDHAAEALHSIGASRSLQGKIRWGHAIIGVKGAPSGSALESLDWMRPVSIAAGEGATEPHLAAAFSDIAFSARSGR
jgi:hypothetical protein